jgi:hypothetical protein
VTLRTRRAYLVAVLAGATTLSGATAYAQAKDTAATKLADDALMNEYLAMDFEGPSRSSRRRSRCAARTSARRRWWRACTGISGRLPGWPERRRKGKAEFAAAVAADPPSSSIRISRPKR